MAGTSVVTRQMWRAARQINPGRVLKESEQPFSLAVVASNLEEADEIRGFLLGKSWTPEDEKRLDRVLRLYLQPLTEKQTDELAREAVVVLAACGARQGLERIPGKVCTYHPEDPAGCMEAILNSDAGAMLRLSLARHIPVLRPEVATRIVRQVSLENATFAVGTALGNVVPSIFQPIMGVAEAAGDIVFLTANQVRMMFMIASSYGRAPGYATRWREMSTIFGAAFTWRAVARNLVSKIPFGAGLVPKGAIAYAGTYSVGEGLVFYYTTGHKMSREDAQRAFQSAYSGAVERVRQMVNRLQKAQETPEKAEREEPRTPVGAGTP